MSRLAAALLAVATGAWAQEGAGAPDAGAAAEVTAPTAREPAASSPPEGTGPAGLGLTLWGVRLALSGFVQVDAVPFSQSSLDELDPATGAPLNEVAISLRRAHLTVEASRWLFLARLEAEATSVGGLSMRLFAAKVAARWPESGELPLVQLEAGLVWIPFGRDVQEDALRRPFLEHATWAEALFPGSLDLGVALRGGWRFLRYQLAVMDGEPSGTRAFPGLDPDAAKDLVGRLGVSGELAPPVRLAAGASGLWGQGFHPGTPGTKDALLWRDANEDGQVQLTELQVVGGLPATPSKDFNRFALGADVHLAVDVPHLGTLDAVGEVVWARSLDRGLYVADPVALGRDMRELGWTVSLVQALPWGFTVGLRLDGYQPDADASDQQGASLVPVDKTLTTWTAVASWRWQRTARVLVEYRHQTNALGRDAGGHPATLGADKLTVRAEVAF